MGIHNKNKQYGFASVQPRDAQVVGKNKANMKKIAIISASIIGLVLVAWGVSAFMKSDLKENLGSKVSEVFEEKDTIVELNTENSPQNSASNAASVALAGNISSNQKVKLALLASPDLFDYRNHKKVGCDALVFAEAEIPRTPRVLSSTLALLFNDDFNYGFPPANFISSTQNDLKFESVAIEKGVARVFLTGKLTIKDDFCDEKRIQYQIEETAKQFSTVKSVEIYLNGEKTEL